MAVGRREAGRNESAPKTNGAFHHTEHKKEEPVKRYEPKKTVASAGGAKSSTQPRKTAPAPKPAQKPAPVKKMQVPTGKKNRGIRMSNSGWMLYILIIILLSCAISYYAIVVANDMFGLVKTDSPVAVTITKEMELKDVAKLLKDEGIISHPEAFVKYCELSDKKDLNYGNFDLNTNMTYQQVLSELRGVSKDASTVDVQLTEGWTLSQMYDALDAAGVCSKEKLAAEAQDRPWKWDFLASNLVPADRANRLEGYLFPDTYNFYMGDTATNVLNKILTQFDSVLTDEYKARAQELGMSIDEVVTLASIIQKEAAGPQEMTTISSVFHNRLNGGQNGLLQSDATLKYIIGANNSGKLDSNELKTDSPYNTYLYKGLPPGPICNPGADAIWAALYPADTDYQFFVAMADGSVSLFATTYEEHQANIQKAGQ